MSKPPKLTRGVARDARRSARSPLGDVLRSALADDLLRMLLHEPGALRSLPEDVHQMRTAVRRLRSDLRFLGPAMLEERSRPLRVELKWLAGVLGEVRDLDVLEDRLRGAVVSLHLVAETDPLFEELDRRRGARRAALVEAISGDRYAGLRRTAIAEARSPGLSDEADRPAGGMLVDRLSKDWRRLIEEVESAPADAPIEALHELRKRAKRTRYAAESAAGRLGDRAGKAARRIGRRCKEFQEALGLVQDAAVAVFFIREVADLLPDDGPARSALDALIDHQHREADAALGRYAILRDRLAGA
ncbi:CHAD domain-containing protein [Tautonia plasticadhaerens]|uniref:CHAD domain protein n=1 Tax=Tautonia plasticadhaerens TaxID=2527974 RepID=A0A518HBT3_9BACT|nr:CHAD domain-containing protein [Tautonia plasticadhaerens]QDV38305.1 CHAD domain protein [Tautonia plasticadhaerens]